MASNIVEIKLSEIDKVQEVLSKQNKEIERLNNIIKEKDKDFELLRKAQLKKCQEYESLEKLNNANYQSFIETNHIINELEKYCNEEIKDYDKALNSKVFVLTEKGKESYEAERMCFLDMLDKIKELKGSDKE